MADYNISMDVVGGKELANALRDGGSFARKVLKEALNTTAADIDNLAIQGAPHKRGELRSSIHVEAATEHSLTAKVGTDLPYARAQDSGTKGMTISVPNGRRIVRGGKFYGISRPYTMKGNISPTYYMRNAFSNGKIELDKNIKAAINKIVSNLAGK